MPPPGICGLCEQKKSLLKSHIIPKFVVNYLKDTSATGFLRGAVDPNLRRQDLDTQPLFCRDCEQLIGTWESNFRQHAFKVVQDDGFRELAYGSWLLKFAVSLAFRVLLSSRGEWGMEFPQFKQRTQEVIEEWRLFLLGKHSKPGTEHHLFVIPGIPQSLPKHAHPKVLHYLLRAIDATAIVSTRGVVGVYCKLVRSIFYSPMAAPAAARGWKNTRIHAGEGKMSSPQIMGNPVGSFLLSRVKEAFAEPLSDAQHNKIAEAILKNPERSFNSEVFKVHLATKQLIRKRD